MKRELTLKIARCGLMGAMIYASQVALSGLPNFETVTLLIIVFASVYGQEAFWSVAVFNLCELTWGFGTWWISYLYIWNLLVMLTLLLRKIIKDDVLLWAAFAAVFGLSFGALCSLVYIPVSLNTAKAYWLSGLYWDIWHGAANFVLMLALFKPLRSVLLKLKNK